MSVHKSHPWCSWPMSVCHCLRPNSIISISLSLSLFLHIFPVFTIFNNTPLLSTWWKSDDCLCVIIACKVLPSLTLTRHSLLINLDIHGTPIMALPSWHSHSHLRNHISCLQVLHIPRVTAFRQDKFHTPFNYSLSAIQWRVIRISDAK